MSYFWAPGEPEWDRVVASVLQSLERGEHCGLDTEFHGCDPSRESTVGRARVHLWSVAVFRRPEVIHARGYRCAAGAVLPVAALDHPPLRALLEDGPVWDVHNLPVDAHTLANHGVRLTRARNTLALTRWFDPHRVPSSGGTGFGLKALKVDVLGKPPGPSYRELMTEKYEHVTVTRRKERRCECGMVPCKKRGAGHERHDEVIETPHFSQRDREIPLTAMTPEHPLFATFCAYSAEDAVDALELGNYYDRRTDRRAMPW